MSNYIAVDNTWHNTGRLLLSDSANHCLRTFDPRLPGPVAVLGLGRGRDDGQLEWPQGICCVPGPGCDAGDILVADRGNRRVCVFDGRTGLFRCHLLTDLHHGGPTAIDCINTTDGGGDGGCLTVALTRFTLAGHSQCDVYRCGGERSLE